MSLYDPTAGFTGDPDPARLAWGQAAIADARRAAGGASLDIFPAADFVFVDPLAGDPQLAEGLEDIATVTRDSKAWSMAWSGVNGEPAGALVEHAVDAAAWSPRGLTVSPVVENLIPNPRAEGSALPATPTGWGLNGGGATITPSGRGQTDGWPWIEVTIDGDVSGGYVVFHPAPFTVTVGDPITATLGVARVSGSGPDPTLGIIKAGGALEGAAEAVTPTPGHSRWGLTRIATTTSAEMLLFLATGAYDNMVLRLYTPTLTLTDWIADPVLPPAGTPGATVRAQDVVSAPTDGWFREDTGTLIVEFIQPAHDAGGTYQGIVQIGPAVSRGRGLNVVLATGRVWGWVRDDTDAYELPAGVAGTPGQRMLAAISWGAGGQRTAANGVVSALYGAAAAPAAASFLTPYGAAGGVAADERSGAPVQRIRYFPREMDEAELIQQTTAHWDI